jgi:putative transposase
MTPRDPAPGAPAGRVARVIPGEPCPPAVPAAGGQGGKKSPQPSERQAAGMPSPDTGAERLSSQRNAPVRGRLKRSYKFLLRPTAGQARMLAECLEDHRQLYNAALEERREAWRMGRHRVTFYSQSAQIKEIRAADPERYGRWSFNCARAAIRQLDRTFEAFFRRIRTGDAPGYPRFKGRGRFDSVEWTEGDGSRWDSVPHPTVTRVYFKGVGHVRVHQHRAVKGTIKTITVKREAGRWYVALSCDDVPAEPLESTGAVIGIDMGIAHFLTASDGRHVPNPRPRAAAADRLAAAQRSLARKKRGSNRRRKAVRKVAAIHRKVRRTRLDHAHKTALALVGDHDMIVCEDLKIANMTRRPKPRPGDDGTYEPNGAAAKTGLNRSIHDAGWGVFLGILHAKAESAGRVVIEVDPRHTSQRCAECGHVAAGNRVSQAEFRCVKCGHEAHADVNAAVNILRAGLARQEAENAA